MNTMNSRWLTVSLSGGFLGRRASTPIAPSHVRLSRSAAMKSSIVVWVALCALVSSPGKGAAQVVQGGHQDKRQSILTMQIGAIEQPKVALAATALQKASGVPHSRIRQEIQLLLAKGKPGAYIQVDRAPGPVSLEFVASDANDGVVALRTTGQSSAVELKSEGGEGQIAFFWVNHAAGGRYTVYIPPSMRHISAVINGQIIASARPLLGAGPWLVEGGTAARDR